MTTTIALDKKGNIRIIGKCGVLHEGKCKIKKDKTGDKMSLELECDLEKIKSPKSMKNQAPAPRERKPFPKSMCPIDLRYFQPKKVIRNDKELVDLLLKK